MVELLSRGSGGAGRVKVKRFVVELLSHGRRFTLELLLVSFVEAHQWLCGVAMWRIWRCQGEREKKIEFFFLKTKIKLLGN